MEASNHFLVKGHLKCIDHRAFVFSTISFKFTWLLFLKLSTLPTMYI